MWILKWEKEEDVEGNIEDQIKALRSRVRDLRRTCWIMWVCFLLTTAAYFTQYVQVRLGQQQLYEAVKENQDAFENLETAISRFIGMIHG